MDDDTRDVTREDGGAVSRRETIRGLAGAATLAWARPAMRSMDSSGGFAFSPGLETFSVRLNPNGGCHDASGGRWRSFTCMRSSPNLSTEPGGCELIAGLDKTSDGRWFVSLATDVVFVEGWSRSGNVCTPSSTPAGSNGPVEFLPGLESPPPKQINEVQLTIGLPPS